jgi:hypothetical protein
LSQLLVLTANQDLCTVNCLLKKLALLACNEPKRPPLPPRSPRLRLRGDVARQSSYNLIGREVAVDTAKGEVTGLVESVTQTAAGAKISIAGQLYPFSSVTRVAAATPAQPQS